MIDDIELREIFKVESAEHIQRLEEGFLRLEKDPHNVALLEEVFREAHSLKGAARIIGQGGVESLSHRLEGILDGTRNGSIQLSAEIIDRLCCGLDAIRKLVMEAVTGEPSGVVLSRALEQLRLEESNAEPGSGKVAMPPQKSQFATLEAPVVSGSLGSAERMEEPAGDFRLDTIRVETKRLDVLMSQAGELNVTKLRINRRADEIKDAITLYEEVLKNAEYGGLNAELMPLGSVLRTPHSAFNRLGDSLNSLKNSLYVDSSRLDFVNAELEGSINRIRLLPLSTIFNLFQRMVRDLANEKGKNIQLVITGGETFADKRIIEEMKDPLMHLVRNAVDHGIELPAERERKDKPPCGIITIAASRAPANLVIEVSDDGQGLDSESIKRAALKAKVVHEGELAAMNPSRIHSLIFLSGVSTSKFISDVSGRGVGLDVVRAHVERLKGVIEVESLPDLGCTIRVKLPLTLATSRIMLVAVNKMKYAVPLEHIQTTCRVQRKELFTIEGRQAITFNGAPIPVMGLGELLELKGDVPNRTDRSQNPEALACIILTIGDESVGIFVDELLDEQEIVLKQYSNILKRVRNVSGATILGSGEVCMVLNPVDMVKTVKMKMIHSVAEQPVQGAETIKCILVAEDSMTVRTQMKRIIEGAGYEVEVAVDGVDALQKLSGRSFDALVSDINMPNMNGLTLTEKVRQSREFKDLPVILVTSLASDEDKQRGLEAGANAYIPKPAFDQKVFLEALGRLV